MSKNTTWNPLVIVSTGLCCLCLLLAIRADAQPTFFYWDNNGTSLPSGGIFDTSTANWSTSSNLTASTVPFTSGNIPVFTAGSNSAGVITVTNNTANLQIAGLDNNGVAGSPCTLTLAGTGSFTLLAGQDPMFVSAGAATTMNVPLNGPGQLVAGGPGSLQLYTNNSYSGGTVLPGGSVVDYNSSSSFGTGIISNTATGGSVQIISNGSGGLLTIPNAFVINNNGSVLNFASGNTISSGPWTLLSPVQIRNNSGSAPLTISGAISGPFGIFVQNGNSIFLGNGLITLSGANTYTGPTSIGWGTNGATTTVSVSSINSVNNPPQQPSSSLGVPSSVTNGTITMGFSTYPCDMVYTGPGETSDRVFSLTGTTGTVTIQTDGAGPLVLTSPLNIATNGTKTFTLQGSNTATNTFMGAIPNSGSGAISLTKAQAGSWVLTGSNTYTGPTTLSGGSLTISGSGVLGNGTYAGLITNNATFIYNSSAAQTLSGVMSGTGLLEDTGSGVLTMSAVNTFTGGITNSGSLTIGGAGRLNTGSYAGNITNNGTFTYNSSAAQTLSGVISGTGAFVNSGSGAVTLTGVETFTGNITTSGGALTIGTAGSLGGGSYAGSITDNGTFKYNSSTAQTLSGNFSGTGALNQSGPGSLTLSGSTVNYTGATTVTASNTLFFTGSGGANATSSLTIAAAGTLDVSGLSTTTYTLTNATSLTATGNTNAAATINGASGGVVNLGALPISLTFSPTNFTGDSNRPALVISQASLALNGNAITVNNASGNPLGTGNYMLIQAANGTTGTPSQYVAVLGSGLQPGTFATVQVAGGNVFLSVQTPARNGPTWRGNDYATSPNWSHSANWLGGVPDLTGDLVFFANTSPQTPVMDGSYSVFSLVFNPTCAADIMTASGTNILTVGSGLTNSSTNLQTLNLPVRLANLGSPTVSSQWDTTSASITVNGVVSDVNNGLTVFGGNALTLNGLNTYTGGTTISGTTLNANTIADANSSIGPSGSLTLTNGATLAFSGTTGTHSRTVAVSGTTNNILSVPTNSTLSLNGQVHSVSDTAAQMLTLTGGGTLSLGGTLDNSGLTMAINQGKVVISKSSASTVHGLGSGTTTIGTGTVGNSAGLQLAGSGGFDLFSGCILTVNGVDGFVDLNGQNDSFSTLTLSGGGPNGNGVLINSANGTTSTITNGGSAVVLATNTTIGGAGSIWLASAVSGTGFSLTYGGTGTLTLGAVGSYTGGTTVNTGSTLQITAGSTGNSGAGSGPVTLNGSAVLDLSMTNTSMNNVITGGGTSVMNISMGAGNLWLSNAPASQLNNFSGTFNVSSTATNGGQLVIGTSNLIETINSSAIWQIQSGAVVDFNVNQTNPATVYLFGLPYTGAANGSLRLDDSLQSGNVILMGNSQIGNGSPAGASTVSGIISDGGHGYGFTKMGTNPVALTATNTYGGATIINAGALQLIGSGSISNSSSINVAAGATFDVSGRSSPTFSLSSANSLSATGTSSNTATINGASGGTVNLGSRPVTLTFAPQTFTGDTLHPALNVSQGALALSGNPVTVNNAGALPLGIGTYTLVQVTGGTITGSATLNGAVGGSGLASGTAGSLSVSGGALNLVVVTGAPTPVFNSVVRSGGNLILSGINGPANATFVEITSTNVSLPRTNWTPIYTNTFSPTGSFSVTNAISGPKAYFSIQTP